MTCLTCFMKSTVNLLNDYPKTYPQLDQENPPKPMPNQNISYICHGCRLAGR